VNVTKSVNFTLSGGARIARRIYVVRWNIFNRILLSRSLMPPLHLFFWREG